MNEPPQAPAANLADEFRTVHDAEPVDAQGRPAISEADVRLAHFEAGTTALCLSGGGIRSASFCLGVVQGLAKRGLLSKFDYLSTVSGGGYLGGMLAAWMYRAPGGAAEVEQALGAATRDDGGPIAVLRRYVRYLAPKQGFFSVDTWTLVATYVRNFTLNALIWLPALGLALIGPMLVGSLVDWVRMDIEATARLRTAAIIGSGISVLAILGAIFALRRAISGAARPDPRKRAAGSSAAMPPSGGPATNRHVQQALCAGVLLLSASAYWLAFADPDALWQLIIATANDPQALQAGC